MTTTAVSVLVTKAGEARFRIVGTRIPALISACRKSYPLTLGKKVAV